jgi:hypothetical protein
MTMLDVCIIVFLVGGYGVLCSWLDEVDRKAGIKEAGNKERKRRPF